jgi:hypothetical protein
MTQNKVYGVPETVPVVGGGDDIEMANNKVMGYHWCMVLDRGTTRPCLQTHNETLFFFDTTVPTPVDLVTVL